MDENSLRAEKTSDPQRADVAGSVCFRRKDDNQQYFQALHRADGMRLPGGHDDGVAGLERNRLLADGHLPLALKGQNKGIARGGVRVDLFALVKGKKGYAHSIVLNKRFAGHLTRLTVYLRGQRRTRDS